MASSDISSGRDELWERLVRAEAEKEQLRERVIYLEGAIDSLASSLGAFLESWRTSILSTSPVSPPQTESSPVVGE